MQLFHSPFPQNISLTSNSLFFLLCLAFLSLALTTTVLLLLFPPPLPPPPAPFLCLPLPTIPLAHPSCLGMSKEAGQVASTYGWQCLDCKTCCVCSDPGGEEEMVFCDRCDRGYHTFCVDMKGIPEGGYCSVVH